MLSARIAIPILRSAESDRLCLRVIGWLHSTHQETAHFPPAVADGFCAIWPYRVISPVYFFPSLEQRGLLYQPLQFHEFGHLLYACHEHEMDDLVAELQRGIARILTPISRRNDRYAEDQLVLRQRIVNTWYNWIQEIFCDAVGFTIGGPCFVHAFSSFLSTLQRQDFYQPSDMLSAGAHPVTWLRVQFLAQRAADAGFDSLANDVEREWRSVARILRIEEDYHGFYDPRLLDLVMRTVEDMLIEASPRPFEASEVTGLQDHTSDVPISLLNTAWRMFRAGPDAYRDWEQVVIEDYLA